MKTLLSCLAMLVLVLGFSSCQREVDGNLDNRTQIQSDSTITKLVILDTTQAPGMDTMLLMLFTYDANKRLSKFSNIYFKAATAIHEAKRDYSYNYTGNDSVPYRLLEDYQELLIPGGFKDTAYYFYQGGVLVKDSSTEFNGYYVNTYAKLSATRYRTIKLLVGTPPSNADTCFSYLNWQNGNLLAEIDSEYLFQPRVLVNVAHNQMTYDNKINPLKELFIPFQVPLYPSVVYNQYLVQFGITPSANNVLTWQDDSGTSVITYVYNAAGLPKIARAASGATTTKFMYYYTML